MTLENTPKPGFTPVHIINDPNMYVHERWIVKEGAAPETYAPAANFFPKEKAGLSTWPGGISK